MKSIIKMQKKILVPGVFVFITFWYWVLWSTNKEMQQTILNTERSNYYMKSNLLMPSKPFCEKRPFLIIIVTSYVGHVELRSAHRRAMPLNLLHSMNVTRIFLIARIPPEELFITQTAIIDEHNIYGDLLQGSFNENYRNLTYKHLMGLNWASNVCRSEYVLKVDDDIVFDLKSTIKLLKSNNKSQNFLMGYLLNNTVPRRDKQNKWYVTNKEYTGTSYPQYLSGWYYIATSDVASQLCDEAMYHQYFWIDDIYVTGILRKEIGVKLRQLPENYWLEYYELLECCLTDMINKFISCDFVVGPNGGRNNLIVEFNTALTNCDVWRNCTKRPDNTPLKSLCVVKRDRQIFSDGKGEVILIKS